MITRFIIVGILMLMAITMAAFLLRVAYKRSVWATSEKAQWVNCEPCAGCGVTMLDGSPIPKEYRTYYRSASSMARMAGVIQGRIANTKNCGYCHGVGHVWKHPSSNLSVFSDDSRRGSGPVG